MEIKIVVATHKPYPMPEEALYLPVQAGAACHERLDYTGDDSGENISVRNGLYCELTALYWAWKNLPAEVLGLCHYRRYFQEPGEKRVLTERTLAAIMERTPVILPKKRNYLIETGESQFVHAHGAAAMEALRGVVSRQYPAYRDAFERSLGRTSGHRFNMLIMRRDLSDAYCEWLFGVLSATEARLGDVPPRMMGYLSERLIDAWIETEGLPYRELPVFLTEKENWAKKGSAFLLRKLRGTAARSENH